MLNVKQVLNQHVSVLQLNFIVFITNMNSHLKSLHKSQISTYINIPCYAAVFFNHNLCHHAINAIVILHCRRQLNFYVHPCHYALILQLKNADVRSLGSVMENKETEMQSSKLLYKMRQEQHTRSKTVFHILPEIKLRVNVTLNRVLFIRVCFNSTIISSLSNT